ncbi:MAG: hypothetical protein WA705_17125 [Candidatus Ozemobacteraceae bacterium]
MPKTRKDWALYESNPSFVLGFHGCDKEVGEKILSRNGTHLNQSENDYDWLGHGIYFWEQSPERAVEFAEECKIGGKNSKGKIREPFVIGAIIDLKHCFNLMDRFALLQLEAAFNTLKGTFLKAGLDLPSNGETLRKRNLDCAVFQTLHALREEKEVGAVPFDSIRGLFFEGDDLYEGAGFKKKNHIQICVRNTDCIKGYFRPIRVK